MASGVGPPQDIAAFPVMLSSLYVPTSQTSVLENASSLLEPFDKTKGCAIPLVETDRSAAIGGPTLSAFVRATSISRVGLQTVANG